MNTAFHARPARRIAVALFVLAAAFANAAQALDLTSLLMNRTGVTKPQAVGGAGSIFKYAKSQMTAENFGLIKQAVPGMSKYLAAAPAVNTKPALPNASSSGAAAAGLDSGSLMNGASQALKANGLGGLADKPGAAQALAPAFEARPEAGNDRPLRAARRRLREVVRRQPGRECAHHRARRVSAARTATMVLRIIAPPAHAGLAHPASN
ncbi:MAG: DUF2780 domain-containing protein [Gammaproteobacteria bacterium]|nr:DUF2780 domain-containing protein [Gammaproteobacteria bacterium]